MIVTPDRPCKRKLVRDRDFREDDNPEIHVVELLVPLHQTMLRAKLIEELVEHTDNPWSIEEYADMLQILKDLAFTAGIHWSTVEREQLEKERARGGFRRGRFAYTYAEDWKHHSPNEPV
jgi:predicted house-cleaning noncanonical NTP pyrophosphatase (MazG superfamily)